MENNRKVIIIGAGIAGISLALFLKKIGLKAALFEFRGPQESMGGGLNIAPNGMYVLAALGLAGEVMEKGCPVSFGVFKNAKGSALARMKYSDSSKYAYPAVNIRRQALLDSLKAAALEQVIEVHYNKKLLSVDQPAHGVRACFEDGTEVSGLFLVGADGVHSQVRRMVCPSLLPQFTGIIARGGFIARNKLPYVAPQESNNLNFVFGKDGFFGYGGANEQEIMWWTNIPADHPWSREELHDFDRNAERRLLLDSFGNYASPVPQIIREVDSYLRINVFDVPFLPNWYRDRLLLIGDAAHAVSPNSGQGASLALEDAMLLAKLLRDEKSLALAFRKFEDGRRPRVERIVREGRRRGEDKLVVGPAMQLFREWMIRIFVNLFGSNGNDWLFRYKIEW